MQFMAISTAYIKVRDFVLTQVSQCSLSIVFTATRKVLCVGKHFNLTTEGVVDFPCIGVEHK
jgi:hypothetical protein